MVDINRFAKAALKVTIFSSSIHSIPHSSVTLQYFQPRGSTTALPRNATLVLLSHPIDLSIGWVMVSGAGRLYYCFRDKLRNLNYICTTAGWIMGMDVEIMGSGDCYIGLTVCDGTLHIMVLFDALYVPNYLIKHSKDQFHRIFSVT